MLNLLCNRLVLRPFKLVILESFNNVSRGTLKNYIKNSKTVYLIEPFVAYHIKNGPYHGFTGTFPDYIEQLLQKGVLKLLPADSIDGKSIYRQATDKAVEVIESVFPEYRKEHKELFEYVSDTLQSSVAENAFKKNLCDKLAEFYSVNILLHRIEKLFNTGPVLVYPDINVSSYLYLKSLLSKSNQTFFEHPDVQFPVRTHIAAFFENLKVYLITMARLSAQTLASGLLGGFHSRQKKEKRSYSYGVAIVSPTRQLKDIQQRPDFIIDNNKIHAEDVVYLPIVALMEEHKKQLTEMPGAVYYPPKVGRCFSHFSKWIRLFWLALKKNFLRNAEEINTACNVFFHYFSWLKVQEDIEFKHFITYCDFGIGHIGRNIAMNQTGIQTWYFTDSMNLGCNLRVEEEKCDMRHPFWTYLNYDHFVTWDELLTQYFKKHPGTFKQVHVIGCLWGKYIDNKATDQTTDSDLKKLENSFKIVAFDSTYSRNGFTSYKEGLAFAEHLLKLADEFPGIYILFKEKKNRDIHLIFDPVHGPRLLELYKNMDDHPRMIICSDQADPSELISISNMVVSFPFTSTTFEALSANKPAIWHDPMGCYMSTPYSKIDGVLTHNYEELKTKVMEIKDMETNTYRNPIPLHSPLMDPYRDGNAITRFRELLTA